LGLKNDLRTLRERHADNPPAEATVPAPSQDQDTGPDHGADYGGWFEQHPEDLPAA